jgi:hypothetical protein
VKIKSIKIKYPKTFYLIYTIVVFYLLLLIPLENNSVIPEGNKKPFIWNQDSVWNKLETTFIKASSEGCDKINPHIESLFMNSEKVLNEISGNDTLDDIKTWQYLEFL